MIRRVSMFATFMVEPALGIVRIHKPAIAFDLRRAILESIRVNIA
jgi:hypothetical protein